MLDHTSKDVAFVVVLVVVVFAVVVFVAVVFTTLVVVLAKILPLKDIFLSKLNLNYEI